VLTFWVISCASWKARRILTGQTSKKAGTVKSEETGG
jgi:hypothetical protein